MAGYAVQWAVSARTSRGRNAQSLVAIIATASATSNGMNAQTTGAPYARNGVLDIHGQ